ncbi:hypothetical protein ACP4OV_015896 [Aristida adscensionis]
MEPPPALVDDVVGEVLLRLPPDDPALLVRASAVCRAWRRRLTDAAFLRRYRRFHRRPPTLGLLVSTRFVPTGSFRRRGGPGRRHRRVLDCRHGRVLFSHGEAPFLLVWDPTTDEERRIPYAGFECSPSNAAVLCAAAGCDHLDCRGGPFLVVLIGTDNEGDAWLTRACVYSSESGEWGAPTTTAVLEYYAGLVPPVLAQDTLYFICDNAIKIFCYALRGERGLSLIDAPEGDDESLNYVRSAVLMPMEDGGLRFAGLIPHSFNLHLWSLETIGQDGVARWTHLRAIKLDTLLPNDVRPLCLVGSEGVPDSDVVLVSTDDGVFMVGLESHSVRKVRKRGVDEVTYCPILPYMSFFTPDRAVGKMIIGSK